MLWDMLRNGTIIPAPLRTVTPPNKSTRPKNSQKASGRNGYSAWAICGGYGYLRQACAGCVPILNSMDFKKTALCLAGLALAVGGPISVFSTADMVSGGKKPPAAAVPGQQPASPDGSTTGTSPAIGTLPIASSIDNAPLPSLADVLRFDATVEWILQRWPRVTTGLPHLQLQGYRVTLLTGSGLPDVAGSLTYYFNAQQQVQRITLRGTTGDPSVLVSILTTRHRFTRRLTNDPGVIVYETVDSSNRPAGSLKIRSAKVISANQPYMRFEVDLVMDRAE